MDALSMAIAPVGHNRGAHRRIVRRVLGVVDILVAGEAAKH
jgi:hypothetical protein